MNSPAKLDQISWHILETLQADARLGRRVGLPTPAVTERVKKLEDAGVIARHHALVDPFKLGISMQVIVRIAVNGGEAMVRNLIKEMHEIVQRYRMTGESYGVEMSGYPRLPGFDGRNGEQKKLRGYESTGPRLLPRACALPRLVQPHSLSVRRWVRYEAGLGLYLMSGFFPVVKVTSMGVVLPAAGVALPAAGALLP